MSNASASGPEPRASRVPDVGARLDGVEDLPVDLQIRTLAGLEEDLRAALDEARD